MTDRSPGREDEPSEDDEGGDWRFSVDEVGEDGKADEQTLEPGSPSIENAFFVLLGVFGTLFVLFVMA
ncbi:DUF7312 domain-containing protein [Halegenticoccus tardaugens]|uniref:DUF7312 domain-containing protein n=1 Tax=Halegenticoccus tardaugens TaxID=2071624 RepID=UPI00100AB49A|nr:hypothetical protein [Halegenticoccus tardaugens]